MSQQNQAQPTVASTPPAAAVCRRAGGSPARGEEREVACPACGSPMRLWANYHRCRNCGYKESCCF